MSTKNNIKTNIIFSDASHNHFYLSLFFFIISNARVIFEILNLIRISFDLVIRACQLEVIRHFGSSNCCKNRYRMLNFSLSLID